MFTVMDISRKNQFHTVLSNERAEWFQYTNDLNLKQNLFLRFFERKNICNVYLS